LWQKELLKEGELEKTMSQFKESLKKINWLSEENLSLEKNTEDLSRKNTELKQDSDDWRLKVGELQSSLIQMSDSSKKWEERSREQQEQVLESRDALKELNEDVHSLRGLESVLRQDLEDFETVQREHLAELGRYDAECEEKRLHNRKLEEENDRMLRSMNRLNNELLANQKNLLDRDDALRTQRKEVLEFKNHISELVLMETDSFFKKAPEMAMPEVKDESPSISGA
jgi:methyl-accepting chemotaxis protein